MALGSSGRSWNASGGQFGAPTDISAPDPRFTLTRAPGYANRPASVVLRSDDALATGFATVVSPASFQLALTTPIIGAKAVGVKQAVVRNLLPTVPDYQRWFLYQVYDAGTATTRTFVFNYLYGTSLPLPIVLTQVEFAQYLNDSTAFTVEVPSGQQVSEVWYQNAIAAGATAAAANFRLVFASTSTDKMALSLVNAAPVGSYATLCGLTLVKAFMNPLTLPLVGGARRYDLMLNNLVGQPGTEANWPYVIVRVAAGPATVLPEFANINATQTVYVTSNISSNGAQTVSNTSRSIIAVMPVKVQPNENIVHEPSFIHWIWSVSGESINEINVDLLDEDLQPINLPFNCLVEIELAFLYEDSRI